MSSAQFRLRIAMVRSSDQTSREDHPVLMLQNRGKAPAFAVVLDLPGWDRFMAGEIRDGDEVIVASGHHLINLDADRVAKIESLTGSGARRTDELRVPLLPRAWRK